tara:strand:+ start:48771 stop:50363 length:1593 start_codon:yes stop_codon:yes gene_type:complete
MQFNELPLEESLLKAIEALGYESPTEIQAKAIPTLIENDTDFIGQAQTGTGKTAAFLLPLLQKIDSSSRDVQALILSPTRELARQIATEFDRLAKFNKAKCEVVYGGASYDKQIGGIRKNKPQVIVGTPGRTIDLINKGILKFGKASLIILDEADEMLNMGFLEDVEEILKSFQEGRKTWMFSATMPKPIINLVNRQFSNPITLSIKKKTLSSANITQKYFIVDRRNRIEALSRLIEVENEMYGIVFCRTRQETKDVADALLRKGHIAEVLQGEMGQDARDQAMKRFKDQRVNLLICTDVASRGIDVNNLTHVFNFGLPQDNESYVHRIGRTGRAGNQGISLTIISPNERGGLRRIEDLTKQKIELGNLPSVKELKKALVNRELEAMESLLSVSKEKGDDFKVDDIFDLYKENFEGLSKEDILKVVFARSFNKQLRRLNDLGELTQARDRSSGGRNSRGPRAGGGRGGYSRDRSRRGSRDGNRSSEGSSFRSKGGRSAGNRTRSEGGASNEGGNRRNNENRSRRRPQPSA